MSASPGPGRPGPARGVVVTGAASGIGRTAALRFAALGDGVLVVDLDADGTARTVEDVRSAGGRAVGLCGDLIEHSVVDEVARRAVAEFGRIDVVVNNAGVMDRMSAVHETDDAEWERVIAVNLTAPFLLTRAVLPHMLAAGSGVLVFTGSEAGLRGGAAGAAYTAAKHGVAGLVRNLAVMYRGRGVRANAVAPGPVRTGMRVSPRPDADGPRVVGPLVASGSGRLGEAEEAAAAIVFLASDDASFVNGAVLPVDDGWSAV
ncbi:SDR family NAD(P)-dependent oxidoreductase [Streptomyces spiramenti]|uniref:SDR family oxidoreductase n=1 Tax=Streptomyces spiramenti TaxID=2720606 RepID=A0ABX1AU58_9ACTN|nr:SDR family NAD(P)-dependent oxidoreductase [Streptomyces spiramenti]NJP67805.1 SDR family oxidoreductase [Streptomyces spiramenti]